MTVDTQPIDVRTGDPGPSQPQDKYQILAEKVRTYGSTPATQGHVFEDAYAASKNFGNKLDLAIALIRSDWYEKPETLLKDFNQKSEPMTSDLFEKRNIIKLELIKSGKVDFTKDTKKQEELADGIDQFIQQDTLLADLANSLPIGVMGAVATVLLFADATSEEIKEEYRSFTTRSLIRPYLGDIMVRKPKGEVNYKKLVEMLPEKVFEDSESVTYGIIKNYFVKLALTWFTKGEEEGFEKLEEFSKSLPPGKKREFYENVLYDLQETKHYKVPEVFVDTVPGFNAEKTVEFPAFRQKHFAKEFIKKRRDYLNVKTGAGKTSSSYLAMESIGTNSVAIFGPSKARNTWKRESEKIFKDTDGKPDIFLVESGEDLKSESAKNAKYIYISTDLLAQNGPGTNLHNEVSNLLAQRGTDGIIVDEAHCAQNPNSVTAKALRTLTEGVCGEYRKTNPFELPMLHLSATPISDDLNDLDVSMALLYPDLFAYPGSEENGKVTFKKQVLNNPRVAYSKLTGEGLMTQWTLAEIFGDEVPRLEYDVEKIQLTPEQRVLYDWLSSLAGSVEIDPSELIRLQKDVLVNPRLIMKACKKYNLYPTDTIPDRAHLGQKVNDYYDAWQEWYFEKEADIPDIKFGADWIAQYADPEYILQCFFSPELINSVDGLLHSSSRIPRKDCEFRITESPKFSFLKKRMQQDLSDGKKIFIVSPHRKEGITDSFKDLDMLKEEEIDEDSILNSLFTQIDEEWMSEYPKESRVSIDGTRMRTYHQRDEAAKKWRESGTENRVVVATMESVYESMDWSVKKTGDNEGVTGVEVYYLSWPWGWDDFEQMCGRFIRPGIAKPTNIHVLEGMDTLDQGISATVKRKYLLQELTLFGVELSPEDDEFYKKTSGTSTISNSEPTSGQLYKRDVLARLTNTTEEEIEEQLAKIVNGQSGYERFAEAFLQEGRDLYMASAFGTEIAKNILIENGPENILSIGAGTCLLARKVFEDNYPGVVDNMDLNPSGLIMAKGQFPEAVGNILQGRATDLTNIRVIDQNQSGESISIANNTYDAVESSFMLNWTSNRQLDKTGKQIDTDQIDRVRVLKEINRVLKPGGRVVITLPKGILDSEHFETFTDALESHFGFQIVSNRSGSAKATDIKKEVGWIITGVKVDRPNTEGLQPDNLNFLTDASFVLSREKKQRNGISSIKSDSQALFSPKEFVVTNPLTNEEYDAKNAVQKIIEEQPHMQTLKEMKYSLQKGSEQWKAWHRLRKTVQKGYGITYQQAEDSIGKVINANGLATPNLWDQGTIESNINFILGNVGIFV